ncbi:MAG: endonuclease/exonuclease/phosphatase family protein [Phycisphaerae bacterium]
MPSTFFAWALALSVVNQAAPATTGPAATTTAATSRPAAARQFETFEGYERVTCREAPQHAGERVVLVGQVLETRTSTGGETLYFDSRLNRAALHVYARREVARQINPPAVSWVGRWVEVLGVVDEYNGQPELTLTAPELMRPLPGPPASMSGAPAVTTSRPADRIRIGSFNTLNLFDEFDDPYTHDEGTPAKPRGELLRLSETIHRLDADVLALVEVENRGVLERFNRALLGDLGYHDVVLFEGNDARGIDCAVLSRLPVGPVTSYRHVEFPLSNGRKTRFRRDFPRVHIEPAGGAAFDLFVVHLKSKRGENVASPPIRAAEAAEIRRICDGLLAADVKARFVICGDFNDTWESDALKTIRGAGPSELHCFFEDLPADNRITFNAEPHRSMIDFILCSPEMATHYVAKSYRILPGSVASGGSDHNPVSADFAPP